MAFLHDHRNGTAVSFNSLPVLALGVILAGLASAGTAAPEWRENREIWFAEPAGQWKLGLPVGNGRLGAMVQGTWPKGRIQLNDDSIWAQEPPLRHPPTTKDRIAEVQKLVDAGNYQAAHHFHESEIIMHGVPDIGSYQTMGDLWIEHVVGPAPESAGYRRSLDVATGLVTVTQPLADGSTVTQKVVSSAVADCLAIRLTSTATDGLNFNLSLTHPITRFRGVPQGGNELHFEGQAQYDRTKDPYLGTKFHTVLKALPESGSVKAGDGRLEVRSAKAVTLLLTCATDFNQASPRKPLPDDWQKKAVATLAKAAAKPGPRIIGELDGGAGLAHAPLRCGPWNDRRRRQVDHPPPAPDLPWKAKS